MHIYSTGLQKSNKLCIGNFLFAFVTAFVIQINIKSRALFKEYTQIFTFMKLSLK